MESNYKYPFLFRISPSKFVVVIATNFDYMQYVGIWRGRDNDLGEDCKVPDIGLMQGKISFSNEMDAWNYIRHWWQTQPKRRMKRE